MRDAVANQPAWVAWLGEQVRLGSDFALVYAALREKGVTDDLIARAIDIVRPMQTALVDGRLEPPPLIRRAPPQLRRVSAPEVELYTYEDFLSPKECDRILALVRHHLQPSPLASEVEDSDYRNSRTCALANLRSPVAVALNDKICRFIGIRPEYGEGIQAQRYDVGQHYKAHHDYFRPDTHEYQRFAAWRGNRSWTFMVYLNEGMEGGVTRFTRINQVIRPKTGMAVLWNNLLGDGTPNPATEHCSETVAGGFKVIITKWFRVNGDGPVFFD
jgi:prolyl 4-hydroxylase